MTRAEAIAYIREQLRLNSYQARAMLGRPGEWCVLRAEYPGGAPNPIIGAAGTWGLAHCDERWLVTREGPSFSIRPAGQS